MKARDAFAFTEAPAFSLAGPSCASFRWSQYRHRYIDFGISELLLRRAITQPC